MRGRTKRRTFSMSPCDNCHAGCCRSFAVPLTGADILRIERGLNLSFWDFVCRWADPEGSIARQYAPHFYFADEPETPFVISLMHRDSDIFAGTSCCRFLVEGRPDDDQPLGQSRCGIYRYRPAACRVFPARFNALGDDIVLQDIPQEAAGGGRGVHSLCGRPWDPSDLDIRQTLDDLTVARYEMEFFHLLAERWNRSPRSWDLFPAFLRLVYSRRQAVTGAAGTTEEATPAGGVHESDTSAADASVAAALRDSSVPSRAA